MRIQNFLSLCKKALLTLTIVLAMTQCSEEQLLFDATTIISANNLNTSTDGIVGESCAGAGKIEREVWTDITGTGVSSIPVNSTPSSTSELTIFESPVNVGDNYGSRIRGYICVPATGDYTFWIASDDYSELWLSSDENAANKIKIASVSGWTRSRDWNKYASQQSAAISLQAGQKYYIEALHKEGYGGDNLAVGWQLPNGTLERPIPGNRLLPFISSTEISDCSACTYVVPAGQQIIDGKALGLQPGSVIGLDARISYGSLVFRDVIGTLAQPIIIKNCGGTVRIDGTGNGHSIKTVRSEYFRITGGDVNGSYGIIVTGGAMGLNLGALSNHFEVDHLEIQNSGFAGIMAKTDPGCDDATTRENFLMKGITLRNNYIHDSGGEGIYAGNSFFMGMNTRCGLRFPHEIHYIRIFGNILKNTGWDAIQLGCATKGASIYNNTIENYGASNTQYQNSGIQIGAGTGGLCYNNLIKGGTGNGLVVMGLGDNVIYNNVIDQAGNFGIFCDERYSPGPGFKFLNNTIINPKTEGIRIFAELVPMNVFVNNIILNPGSYAVSPETAFVNKLDENVKIEMSNNYFSSNTDEILMVNLVNSNYRLGITSPVIDKGADISPYHHFETDFYYTARLKGAAYDIGAVEY